MSITKVRNRLLSLIGSSVDADASCGRCEETALTQCCRTNYRRFAYVDICGNVCEYRCKYRPDYC